jgi:adenine deaminase
MLPKAELHVHIEGTLEPELLIELARRNGVALPTVCPLSNVALRAVSSLADHALPAMLAQGLKATVNSDDPAYFGGYIEANFAAAGEAMNVTERQIVTLARNSFDACFSIRQQRDQWKAELETMATKESGPATAN